MTLLSYGETSNCRDIMLCYIHEYSCGLGVLPRQKGTSNELFWLITKKIKYINIENSFHYRDVLTNKTSIKPPQNTKYPAQRAAHYKFAVVLCVVQMLTF